MTLSPPSLPFLLKPSRVLQVSINHTLTHSDQQSLEIDNYLDSSILDSSFPTFPGLRAEVSCFTPESWTGCMGLCAPLHGCSVHPQLSEQGLMHSSASSKYPWWWRATALHLSPASLPRPVPGTEHEQSPATALCLGLWISVWLGIICWRRAGSWFN